MAACWAGSQELLGQRAALSGWLNPLTGECWQSLCWVNAAAIWGWHMLPAQLLQLGPFSSTAVGGFCGRSIWSPPRRPAQGQQRRAEPSRSTGTAAVLVAALAVDDQCRDCLRSGCCNLFCSSAVRGMQGVRWLVSWQ